MSKEEISPNSNKLLLGKHFRNKRRWNALPCQVATPVTYLLSEMSEGLSSSQICEPVVYGTLRTCCHQPKIILLIHLGFPSSCVRQRIASQLFCNNTAKIWTDLEKKKIRRMNYISRVKDLFYVLKISFITHTRSLISTNFWNTKKPANNFLWHTCKEECF